MAKKLFLVALITFAIACLAAILVLGYGMSETAAHPTYVNVVPRWLELIDAILWMIAGLGFIALLACTQFLPPDWH